MHKVEEDVTMCISVWKLCALLYEGDHEREWLTILCSMLHAIFYIIWYIIDIKLRSHCKSVCLVVEDGSNNLFSWYAIGCWHMFWCFMRVLIGTIAEIP